MIKIKQNIQLLLLGGLLFLCLYCGSPKTGNLHPAENQPPVANAGMDKSVLLDIPYLLNGSQSYDADLDSLSFEWTMIQKPVDSLAILSLSQTLRPSFTPDREGIYIFSLIVHDGKIGSSPDQVRITARSSVGSVLFVDQASSSTVEDGTVDHPFKTISAALLHSQDEDSIKVTAGNYTENLILPNQSVSLLGGYSHTFQTRHLDKYSPATTITAANPAWPVIGFGGYAGNDCNWYGGDSRITIEGFTLTGGKNGVRVNGEGLFLYLAHNKIVNNGSLSDSRDDRSGGVQSNGLNVVIRQNYILENKGGMGGGLILQDADSPRDEPFLVEENIIENNQGGADHGAGVVISARQGLFTKNLVINNHANQNTDYGWAGGLILTRCRYFADPKSYVELSNNIYRGNTAKSAGGGVFVDDYAYALMRNELIVGNKTHHGRGSGLYVNAPASRVFLINCTLADNSSLLEPSNASAIFIEGDGSAHSADVVGKNLIIWGNSGTGIDIADGGTLEISFSDIQGGFSGLGNIQADPLFVNPGSDYHLLSLGGYWDESLQTWLPGSAQSPGIDAGDPSFSEGNEPMPHGQRINLGAYGGTAYASKSGSF